MTTIADLLKEAEQELQNSESARLDAEVLLCKVLQCERSKLFAHPEQVVSEDQSSEYRDLLQQRKQGQPVAYLIGEKEFWSMTFKVSKDTLIPRPETECLVEQALNLIPKDVALNILELGTGTGAIAITIASERPQCNILATDISDNALGIAQTNANSLGVNNLQFQQSDWFQAIPEQKFDFIISNPPYIRENDEHLSQGDVRFEPQLALVAGKDGMLAINTILQQTQSYLSPEAWLLLEHGFDQKDLVRNCFEKNKFCNINCSQDLAGNDRVTQGQWL